MESIIHREYIVTNNLVVSNGPLSSNGSTEYVFKKICKEMFNNSVYLVSAHPKGILYDRIQCDGTKIDLKLPYWKKDTSDCLVGLWKPGMPDPTCNPDYGSPPGYSIRYRPPNLCLGTIARDEANYYCTNLGIGYSVSDKIDNTNCTIIASTSNTIKLGKYARGVWNYGGIQQCYQEGSTGASLPLAPSLVNDAGGRIITHPLGVKSLRSVIEPSCGTCFTDGYMDPLTKNSYYDTITGRSFPPAAGDTENHCDCVDYEYGYCRNSNNSSCLCRSSDGSSLEYDYNEFNYNFEYCRYQITLKGHSRKIKYGKPDGRVTTSVSSCEGYSGTGNLHGPIGGIEGEVTEECAWVECQAGDAAEWYVYDAISRSQSTLYNAVCPSQLCSINYDNNSLTINLPSGPSYCISHQLRNNCPVVRVEVPDNSFTVSDSISSSCDSCGVEPNKIDMSPQTQNWDIVTETRTCILGYFLTSPSPNTDGPVGMSVQSISCGSCNQCPDCGTGNYTSAGQGLCGKEAPESFPWTTCISFSSPTICVVGNTRYTGGIVAGCDIPITFPASNSVASSRMLQFWSSQMERNLRNVAPCSNAIDAPDSFSRIEDIVEGVVPGSCSSLLTRNISYPAIKYKTTLTGPVTDSLTVTYTVAYYTYQYRRPRTVQDLLKTETIREKCDRIRGSCPTASIINTSEIYKTGDCDSTPQCYNNDIPACDDTNYCCKVGKKNDV